VRAVESTRRLFALAGRSADPVRDQRPLTPGAIAFEAGWDLGRLVQLLNSLCFFWPGDVDGPIAYGRNHYQRYTEEGEDLVVLQIPTAPLFAANPGRGPRFSRVNSGSARCNAGRKAPRGGTTFQDAAAFKSPGVVKEIVFDDVAVLPHGTKWSRSFAGTWEPL
jgi:hypothetical protein